MNEIILNLTAEENETGIRIDKFISDRESTLTRSYIQKIIKSGNVFVNGNSIKSSYKVLLGDEIKICVPAPVELNIKPENIKLDILYEDNDIIVINKPKQMVVHPAAGHYTGTIVNAVLYHCKENLSGINGVLRPGIVHRIDMNTTGAIVVCKNDRAHTFIAEQLKEHSITRKYNALVYNTFKDQTGTIDASIGRNPLNRKKMCVTHSSKGKKAVTHYNVLENLSGKYSHIECTLETGRTHQIRVHMSYINHPLLGDDVYGSSKNPFKLEGQALHARVLGFIHPSTKEYMEFEAPVPEYFSNLIDKLR